MRIPFEKEYVETGIIKTIRQNEIHDDCYIRPIIYRGELPSLSLKQTFHAPVNISILLQLKKRLIATESFKKGSKAIVSWRRISSSHAKQS